MANRKINLRTVAVIQRQLLWLVLGLLVLMALSVGVVDPTTRLVITLTSLGVQIAALVQVCRLARAQGTHILLVVLIGVFMIVPLVNLLIMLMQSGRATKTLKSAGLSVGLMGVNPEQLLTLDEGVCRGCGYDMGGLDGTRCPECGNEQPLVDPSVSRPQTINLRKVAKIQRHLLWGIWGLIIAFFGLVALEFVDLPVVLAVFLWVHALFYFYTIVQGVRLAMSTERSVIHVVGVAAMLFVPLLNLLVLVFESARATRLLEQAGLRVGLTGVKPEELKKLAEGHCCGCGDDLRGLDDEQCPECGLEKQLAVG